MGSFALGTFEEQARLALSNLRRVAQAVGGDLGAALKVNAYLRDVSHFEPSNRIYAEFFPDLRPARTTVQSSLAGFEIEVEAIVALRGHDSL